MPGRMAGFDVWDLVKVPFPYTSRPVQQRRPALVVAAHCGGGMPDLLWVLMVTSAAHRHWPGDYEVAGLQPAGLPAPSIIRSAKFSTIETAAAERIGSLAAADRDAVRVHLNAALRDALLQELPN